jgi:tetratricopeptide (TPR) repeat protein
MRRLAILSLAIVLAASAGGTWAQQINPDRRIPGLPPLGKEQPEPDDPADQQDKDKEQPDAQAPAPDAKQQQRQTGRPTPRAPETDDQLLARLAKAPDRRAARAIERELRARWSHSDSPSADLLLKRVDQAIEAHDQDTAREIATKLTEIAPDFAEGWHRRATLAAERDDFPDAIDSLRKVLALQPKHFIAMAELGQILEEFDDKQNALDAYRKAKELDPFIDGLEDRIRQLSKEVEGQGI